MLPLSGAPVGKHDTDASLEQQNCLMPPLASRQSPGGLFAWHPVQMPCWQLPEHELLRVWPGQGLLPVMAGAVPVVSGSRMSREAVGEPLGMQSVDSWYCGLAEPTTVTAPLIRQDAPSFFAPLPQRPWVPSESAKATLLSQRGQTSFGKLVRR